MVLPFPLLTAAMLLQVLPLSPSKWGVFQYESDVNEYPLLYNSNYSKRNRTEIMLHSNNVINTYKMIMTPTLVFGKTKGHHIYLYLE